MDSVARNALDTAMAGSPGGWRTFPAVQGSRGADFCWHYDDHDGRGHSYIALSAVDSSAYKLVLGGGCHPFTIVPGRLGIWFPDSQSIRVVCVDVESLPDIPRPSHFGKLEVPFHAGTEPLASLLIPPDLPSGRHEIKFPESLQPVQELLSVIPYGAEAVTTIFSLKPATGEVTVYPQQWFDDMFQHGWESIFRVTRHPQRQTIIGDGPRIRPFELTEDGCHLAGWL